MPDLKNIPLPISENIRRFLRTMLNIRNVGSFRIRRHLLILNYYICPLILLNLMKSVTLINIW